MVREPKLIAQGTYGCVYGPPIRCIDPDGTIPANHIDYNEYVSKLSYKDTVLSEMEEIQKMHKIDPTNQFHSSDAFRCTPDLTTVSQTELKKCRIKKEATQQPLRLLMLKYGGISLEALINNNGKLLKEYVQSPTIHFNGTTYPNIKLSPHEKIEIFWRSTLKLFEGLIVMHQNNVSHRDLKPDNILFNPSTAKFTYIDFGFLGTVPEIMEMGHNNKDDMGAYHWSLPLENKLLNLNNFKGRKVGTPNNIIERFGEHSGKQLFLPVEPPGAEIENYDEMVRDYFEFVRRRYPTNYRQFQEQSIRDADIFGLGFSLKKVLNTFFKLRFITPIFYVNCRRILEKMYTYNPDERIHSPTQLYDEYHTVINHSIKNNQLVSEAEKKQMPTRKRPTLSPTRCDALNKDYNPNTGRCVKKCNPGYTRNRKYRCTRRAKQDSTRCDALNKDYNPNTGRCVKKCNPGYTRNRKSRCTKTNSTKKQKQTKLSSFYPVTIRHIKKPPSLLKPPAQIQTLLNFTQK